MTCSIAGSPVATGVHSRTDLRPVYRANHRAHRRCPTPVRNSAAALLVFLATGIQLDAQTVRGRVIDAATGRAVDRGFVVLLDSAGQERARGLTTSEGQFRLRVSEPGLYQLRSERIGYEMWESNPFDLAAGEDRDLSVSVTSLPTRLPTLIVRGNDRCRDIRGDVEFGPVWEEARKALTAASWTQQQGHSHLLHRYKRKRTLRDNNVEAEEVWNITGRALQPFGARHPDSLLAYGFVVDEAGRRVYFGPDANVLLHDSFHQTHCFFAVEGTDEEGNPTVGLAFQPDPNRTLPDIEGTLWIDANSFELRFVEWRYANTPHEFNHELIGGRVSFAPLPSGEWIASDFQVYTPFTEIRRWMGFQGRILSEARLTGLRDTGGEAIEITDLAGNAVYTAPDVALMRGLVFDSIRAAPAENQLVSVLGTGYTTRTDSEGRFEFKALLTGEYYFTVARMDSLGYTEGHARGSFVPNDTVLLDLTIPSVESVHQSVCPRTLIPDSTRALVGVLRDSTTGMPLRDQTIRVWWRQSGQPATRGNRLGHMSTKTDRDGYYAFCRMPMQHIIRLEVSNQDLRVQSVDVSFNGDRVTVDSEHTHVQYWAFERIGTINLLARPEGNHN